MRCQSCQDHGIEERRFCPCCGRPAAEHANPPTSRITAAHPAPCPPDDADPVPWIERRCESCGAPWEGAGTLCHTCERVFARVLEAAHPQVPHQAVASPLESPPVPVPFAAPPAIVVPAPAEASPGSPGDEAPAPPLSLSARETAGHDEDATARLPRPTATAIEAAEPPRPWWELDAPSASPAAVPAPQEPQRPAKLTAIVAVPPEFRVQEPPPPAPPAAPPPVMPPPLPVSVAGTAPIQLQHPQPRTRVRPSLTRPRAGLRLTHAAKVVTVVGALAVVVLLGMPTFQAAWQTAAVALPNAASTSMEPAATAAPPAPVAEVTPAPPTPVPAAAPSGRVATAPPAATAAPLKPEAKREALPARPAKSVTKVKPAPSKKTAAPEAALAAPAPVVVPERAVPVPVQAPSVAVAPMDTASAPALGPTFEAAQVDVRPRVESQVPAAVPERLRNRRLQDVVVLRVRVSASGRPADVQVLKKSGVDSALDGAAVTAVRQWRFSPATRRGEAVNCWMNVGVPFRGDEPDGTR